MKITLTGSPVNITNIQSKLEALNANVKHPNEFVIASANGDVVEVRLVVNNEVVLRFNKEDIGCFKYRDSFVGKFDFENAILELFTYAALHTHTEYSILDGANKIKDLAKKYAYAGAITDHGVMYGCLSFYKEMKDAHKHPIIGFEAYTTSIDGDSSQKYHLVLLAKNETGYQNLIKLCSLGQGNYGGKGQKRPLVRLEDLATYKEGIVVLSACLGGELPRKIVSNDMEGVTKTIEFFSSNFGEDYYLEVQRHASDAMIKQEIAEIEDEFGVKLSEAVIMSDFNKYYPNDKKMFIKKYSNRLYENIKLSVEEDVVNDELKELSKKYGIKMVATNDAHYLNPDDAFMHEALLCNQRSTTLTDKNHWVFPGTGYHVHTTDEMERLFHDEPELLINTLEIADKCKFDFTFGEYKLPKFPIPEGYTDKEYLRKLVLDGFKERFQGTPELTNQEYLDRVEFELETIFKMGYQGYFFIVWDYIRWAKEQGIYVGPGRGSGAGSIVLYCLHITENLDPLKFDLLFERFLNPDRISMPDIDVDFEYELREKVIEYCKMKYGNECVSKIITFGRMAAKSAILDMTRVLDYPLATARKISDMIPKKPGITLKKAMLENVELDALYHNDEEAKTIIDLALKVEGLVRNTSVHACGVIIAPDDVTKFCPQAYAVDDETGLKELTTQYTMGECEEIGLLKMDVRIVR